MSTVFDTSRGGVIVDNDSVRKIEHGFTTWRYFDGRLWAIAVDKDGLRRALTPSEKEAATALGIIKPKN